MSARALLLALSLSTGCIYRTATTREVDLAVAAPGSRSPSKAHLLDGSVVLLPRGFVVVRDTLSGEGIRYNAARTGSMPFRAIHLDSVAGLEAFHGGVNVPATVVLSTITAAVTVVGAATLAVAIFGSCPTFYVDSAGTPILESEGFSYSIARLFEARDVDALHAVDPAGIRVRLELRNEAAETHFLNHVALLVVDRAPGERVLPDPRGRPIAVRDEWSAVRVVDRAGRDVRAALLTADGAVLITDADRLARASAADVRDFIEMAFAAPRDADSVALVLRARNSLLATVLLYDVMLANQGPAAVDWLGSSLGRIDQAVALGEWYANTMGLRVSVGGRDGWEQVAWVGDVGPIAWKDLAVQIPVRGDTMRVRLDFVTDAWRLDRVALGRSRRAVARETGVVRVTGAEGAPRPDIVGALETPDELYFETRPGQRVFLDFDVGQATGPRDLLLVSQGYYTEWIRPDWLRNPVGEFVPSMEALGLAFDRWRDVREAFERRFFATRLEVR